VQVINIIRSTSPRWRQEQIAREGRTHAIIWVIFMTLPFISSFPVQFEAGGWNCFHRRTQCFVRCRAQRGYGRCRGARRGGRSRDQARRGYWRRRGARRRHGRDSGTQRRRRPRRVVVGVPNPHDNVDVRVGRRRYDHRRIVVVAEVHQFELDRIVVKGIHFRPHPSIGVIPSFAHATAGSARIGTTFGCHRRDGGRGK
jgi:hypothetical protein